MLKLKNSDTQPVFQAATKIKQISIVILLSDVKYSFSWGGESWVFFK